MRNGHIAAASWLVRNTLDGCEATNKITDTGLGNLSTRLFCDGDGDRKSLFVPVGILELSVKSPSFRANVRTCILALSFEREYFSFSSSSQSCCNILFWCCYLCRSIFFHVVQILHSNIDKNTDIFISRSFEQKMSAPASDGKPK